MITLAVKRLDPSVPLPVYAREGDAGLDLHAAHDLTLEPGARGVVGTGLAVAIPAGYAGLMLPRSGLALTQGLSILNTPGLVDSGYRGEMKVLLDVCTPVQVRQALPDHTVHTAVKPCLATLSWVLSVTEPLPTVLTVDPPSTYRPPS